MFHLLLQLQLCLLDLRLRELSLRLHVRHVLFGDAIHIRDARPLGLGLCQLLLEVLLVLRRLHLVLRLLLSVIIRWERGRVTGSEKVGRG